MSDSTNQPNVYLVGADVAPSYNFFLLALEGAAFKTVPIRHPTEIPRHGLAGGWLVFVRYISREWRQWVTSNRRSLAGLALFMDDDVLDPRSAVGMPWRYRWKLWRLAARHVSWLRSQGAELWVSTPYLQEKYADWTTKLVLPAEPKHEPVTRVFYHASASHRAEIDWLKPIMQQVIEADPSIRFELIGDRSVRKAWRQLPGVTVVHPMTWSAYLSFSALEGRHIGLAPVLDAPFNRARSYTKFFDITRSGAVGIYSEHPVFAGAIDHGENGLLIKNRPEEWVDAIRQLAADPGLRARLLDEARVKVGRLSEQARDSGGWLP